MVGVGRERRPARALGTRRARPQDVQHDGRPRAEPLWQRPSRPGGDRENSAGRPSDRGSRHPGSQRSPRRAREVGQRGHRGGSMRFYYDKYHGVYFNARDLSDKIKEVSDSLQPTVLSPEQLEVAKLALESLSEAIEAERQLVINDASGGKK